MWDRPRWIAMSPWAFACSSDNYTDPPGPPREPLPVTHFCRKLTNSAEVALRMAERNDLTIDLMLIDVVMPDLSGPDLGERILAIRPHQKVLFMSGFTDHEVVRLKVLDHGLRFLPKPFTPDGLLEAVQMVLSAPAQISDFRHFVTRAGGAW